MKEQTMGYLQIVYLTEEEHLEYTKNTHNTTIRRQITQ